MFNICINKMRFYNHKSSAIFDIYLKLYDSELSFEKKKTSI